MLFSIFKIFDGNTDQFTVVSHKLANPIICRYVRIHPTDYYGWTSLRADFYGCKSGEVLPLSSFRRFFHGWVQPFKVGPMSKTDQLKKSKLLILVPTDNREKT